MSDTNVHINVHPHPCASSLPTVEEGKQEYSPRVRRASITPTDVLPTVDMGLTPRERSPEETKESNVLPPIMPRASTSDGVLTVSKAETMGFVESKNKNPPARQANRWNIAGNKVITANKIASMFETLRDQKQVNELDPRRLKHIKRLGEGAFATVNLCELLPEVQLNRSFSMPAYAAKNSGKDAPEAAALDQERKPAKNQLVAVKCLKPGSSMPAEDRDSFIQEAALTRKLKHKHIVDYVGVGFNDSSSEKAKQESMFIAQEYMAGGTLQSLVSKQMLSPSTVVYTNKQAMEWMLQLAEALAYLHSAIPMVIHRDLKLENVLLTSEEQTPPSRVAKLADFGLVAFVRKEHARKTAPVSAPTDTPSSPTEAGRQELQGAAKAAMQRMGTLTREDQGLFKSLSRSASLPHTPKSSRLQSSKLNPPKQLSGQTGSYMYMSPEMFRSEPYTEKADVFSFGVMMYELFHRYIMVCAISNQGTIAEIANYARQVSCGYRPPIGDKWPSEFRELLTSCMAQKPEDRPSMAEVAARLKAMLKEGVMDSTERSESACCVVS